MDAHTNNGKGALPYRLPRRPSWRSGRWVCERWMRDRCGHCPSCLRARLAASERYTETLRAECRRLAAEHLASAGERGGK